MAKSSDQYDLFAAMDEHITRPQFKAEREVHFYPSEASVRAYDEHGDLVTHGSCLRKSYFRCSGEFEGLPYDARTQYIFAMGNAVEDMLVEQWKQMGIWVANSVKFIDKENNISGELDAILREPHTGQQYGVEVKSFYGYHAEKELFGNKSQKGFPKMGQLLQTLVYLNHFQDRLPYFRMVYFGRDSVRRRTFKIELHKEGSVSFPMIDGEPLKSFSINDILSRYKALADALETKSVPPADFELRYPDWKIEDYYKKGKVAKTNYEKWQKGKLEKNKPIGDWECNYCQFKQVCWK